MGFKKKIVFSCIIFALFFSAGFVLPEIIRMKRLDIEKIVSRELSSKIKLRDLSVFWSLSGPALRVKNFSFLDENLHFKQVDIGLNVFRSLFKQEFVLSFFSLRGFEYEVSIDKMNQNQNQSVSSEISLTSLVEKISKMTTDIKLSDVNITLKNEEQRIKISQIKTKIQPGFNEILCSLSFYLNEKDFFNGEVILVPDEQALTSKSYFFQSENFHLKGRFRIPSAQSDFPRFDFYTHFEDTYFHHLLKQAHQLLPKIEIIKKIKDIVEKGHLDKGHIEIVRDNPQADFNIIGEFNISHLRIKFSDEWPSLDELKAKVSLKNDEAVATISQGHTGGVGIARAMVIGKDLFDQEARLDIRSLLDFDGRQGSLFLQETPLWDDLSFIGGMINLQNSFEMQLALDIPLFHSIETKVVGTLLFKPESKISFYDSNYSLENLNGGVTFNEKGLTRSKVTGLIFEDEFLFQATETDFSFFSYPLEFKYKLGSKVDKVVVDRVLLPEYKSKSKIKNKPIRKNKFKPIDLHIKKFDYDRHHFERVGAYREPTEKGFIWKKINGYSKEISFNNCQIIWQSDLEYQSNTICKFEVHDFASSLAKMGVTEATLGGNGFIDYEAKWRGSIGDYDYLTVESTSKLNIEDFKVKSTKSSMRSFLNYLTFNIFSSDSKDIVIDKLSGEIKQKNKTLNVQNFSMVLPSMDLSVSGEYIIEKKEVDLDATLALNLTGIMKTYGLYSAVALANPAIFAIAWIPGLREFSKRTIGKLFEQVYNIKGQVDNPKIEVKKFANIPIPGFEKKE